MYCKNCGEVMNDNQAICLKCGVKVGVGNSFCANCGNAIAPNAAVCLNCGVAVKQTGGGVNGDYLNGQDKIVIALVCFFLGGFGVHNFMMGEKKKGILKIILAVLSIITCGITSIVSFVVVLIEFIKILMGTYVVSDEKYF